MRGRYASALSSLCRGAVTAPRPQRWFSISSRERAAGIAEAVSAGAGSRFPRTASPSPFSLVLGDLLRLLRERIALLAELS
jgi:hypothetical protein